MLRRLKTVSMMLFLMGLSTGAAFATSATGVDDVKVTQQSETATGVVKDAFGEVVGASVVVKGTTNGVVTDFEGKFSLDNVKKGDILEISFVGYKTQEVKWNGTPLDILLTEDTEMLEEVVVVGYGSQKKTNLTGSVSQVKGEVLESRPVANAAQALQGVVPGLNLSVGSGGGEMNQSLGMNIRGAGNLGTGSSAAPLVLIDGIEGDLTTVNPSDIESISVLKDAASASIYGARGSFGVILVTTKNGAEGKTNVSYSGNVRFNTAIAIPEMANSVDFANYWNVASINSGTGTYFNEEKMNRIKAYHAGTLKHGTDDFDGDGKWDAYGNAFGNTNWFDEFYAKNVPTHEHNISISGGTKDIQYLVSGNYLDQKGLLNHGEDLFNRYTTNAKIAAKLADWVKVDYNLKWTRTDYNRPTYLTSNGGGLFYHNIARRWPVCPVTDPNGNWLEGMEINELENGGLTVDQKDWFTQQLQFVFEPIKDWHITVNGSMQTYTYNQHQEILPLVSYDTNNQPYSVKNGDSYGPGVTRIYEYRLKQDYFTLNAFTDYSKQLGDHWFKVMAGFNAELTKKNTMSGSGYTLNSPNVPSLNQTTSNKAASASLAENSLAGFFGRLNYNYKEKYLLEFNLRYDGASRFVGENQWGLFPSVSAGWNIAREGFWENWKWGAENISTLKFRGSWGQLGNNRTDSWYPFYQVLSTGVQNSSWLIDGKKQNTASMAGIVSSVLTWETVETLDFGFDLNMFNNRLNVIFDWYTRWTYDMVGPAPTLPSILGTAAPQINNTDMKTYGWELEASWRDRIGEVGYGVKFVLADNQSEILKYPNETNSINSYYKGEKLGNIWGYVTEGLAQSQEQMDAWLQNNKPTWGSNWTAGDVMYKDLNGDGVINQGSNTLGDTGDRIIIGNTTARYSTGITVDADWKGIDFSMFWQGILKRDWAFGQGDPYFWGATGNMWQSACFVEHLDYWSEDNQDAYYPRPYLNNGIQKNQHYQTRYLQDASYMRLKNIQIGYTFPKEWTSKIGIQKLRIYFSGDNLLTFTDMADQFDPETLGGYWGSGKTYPLQKSYSFGVNLNF